VRPPYWMIAMLGLLFMLLGISVSACLRRHSRIIPCSQCGKPIEVFGGDAKTLTTCMRCREVGRPPRLATKRNKSHAKAPRHKGREEA